MEHERRTNHLSIFPPINHEDLPIQPHAPPPPPPHAPLTVDSDDHPSSPPPKNNHSNNSNNKNSTQFIKLFDFALHFWNSKLVSFLTNLSCSGLFSSFGYVAITTSFLGFVWFLFRLRRRKWVSGGCGGEESVEYLKALVKSKDEKIIQLLEQIARMNKVLLDRYKIPVLKGS